MKCFLTTKVPKAASCLWSPVGKLFLLLALFVCSTSVHAEDLTYGGYTYTINTSDGVKTAELKSGNGQADGSVFVPDYIWSDTECIPVVSIADGAFSSFKGTYISIGNNVTTVKGKAFEHFGEHKAVTLVLGKGITNLPNKAFEHIGEHQNGCKVICLMDTPPTIEEQSFEHVKNTTFYVKDKSTYDKYVAADIWKGYDASNSKDGNTYQYPIPCYYETTSDKWQTIILADALTAADITNTFGDGTKVAKLTSASWANNTYNLVFTAETKIDANTPYFIKPKNKDACYVSATEYINSADTKDISVVVTNATDKKAHMIGNVSGTNYTLAENEFYFRNRDDKMYFYVSTGSSSFVKPTKCYFKITSGSDEKTVMAKVAVSLDDTVTGISETTVQQVQKMGIYTIDGQYRGNDLNSLPKGLYIVNGKKVVK